MESNDNNTRRQMLDALPHVRRFAISLSHSRADGDDLLQSTVERVLKKGVPEDVDMRKWMFRVCKNIWIDEIRARKVRQRAAEGQDITIHNRPESETEIMDKLKLTQVKAAMDNLPDDQRAALSLVAIEGYSYKDTAEILGTPIGTVMSRLARARKNLAIQFSDGGKPFSPSQAFRA